jgi:hypothetical protein
MIGGNASAPASAATLSRGRNAERLLRQLGLSDSARNPRRQRLVAHLHACGPRPVLEALLAVAAGQSLDLVLEDFRRLAPEIYRTLGADVLPVEHLSVADGGRGGHA